MHVSQYPTEEDAQSYYAQLHERIILPLLADSPHTVQPRPRQVIRAQTRPCGSGTAS